MGFSLQPVSRVCDVNTLRARTGEAAGCDCCMKCAAGMLTFGHFRADTNNTAALKTVSGLGDHAVGHFKKLQAQALQMRRAIDADTQHAAGALKGGSRGDDKILWNALLTMMLNFLQERGTVLTQTKRRVAIALSPAPPAPQPQISARAGDALESRGVCASRCCCRKRACV